MGRHRLFLILAPLAAACGAGGGTSSLGPTASLQNEMAIAVEDDLEGLVSGLVVPANGVPPGTSLPAGCPDVSSTADADGDGVPNDATYTFTHPPCAISGFLGGTLTLGGSVRIQDPSGGISTALNATLAGLAWVYTDPSGTRSYSTTRTGTLTRTGSTSAALITVDLTTSRLRPHRAPALLETAVSIGFNATTPGTLLIGSPLPAGAIAVDGTLRWVRSTEDYTVSVGTVTALQYDPACASPRRFTAGEVVLQGDIRGESGTLLLTWSGCGVDPVPQWFPN
jgi:hypothetical protein